MSEKTPHRRPATFRLDDPGVVVMDHEDSSRPARGTVRVTPEADSALLPVALDAPQLPARRGFRWGTLFWTATAGLVLLGLGLGVVNLIEELFARSESLGFLECAFDLRFQNTRKSSRCQRSSVSGWTRKSACFQVRTIPARTTRSSRSTFRYVGRLICRRRILSWCRKSAFSAMSSDFPLARSTSVSSRREVVGGLVQRSTRS